MQHFSSQFYAETFGRYITAYRLCYPDFEQGCDYRLKFIYILFSITYLVACTKHAGGFPEPTPTETLIITAPTANQVVNKTDSIRVTGNAAADATMHGYDVYITKQADTVKLLVVSVHDHNTTLAINTRFAPQAPGNYEAHVLLKLDHDGHTLHKSVVFKTQ